MLIMSQDKMRLINSEFMREFFVHELPETTQLLASFEDGDVMLGSYSTLERAQTALEFVSFCFNTEDYQDRQTLLVPTDEDMSFRDIVQNADPAALVKALEKILRKF